MNAMTEVKSDLRPFGNIIDPKDPERDNPHAPLCCGAIKADHKLSSAMSNMIANLEARLAIRWAADRAAERKPTGDIVLDATGRQTTRDERDRAVFDAIAMHALVPDIQAAAKLTHAQVLDSIRRLVHAGYVARKKVGGNSIHTQAIGSPPKALDDVPRTSTSNAVDASVEARKNTRAQKEREAEALRLQGLTLMEIANRMGISKSYVGEMLRGMK